MSTADLREAISAWNHRGGTVTVAHLRSQAAFHSARARLYAQNNDMARQADPPNGCFDGASLAREYDAAADLLEAYNRANEEERQYLALVASAKATKETTS